MNLHQEWFSFSDRVEELIHTPGSGSCRKYIIVGKYFKVAPYLSVLQTKYALLDHNGDFVLQQPDP